MVYLKLHGMLLKCMKNMLAKTPQEHIHHRVLWPEWQYLQMYIVKTRFIANVSVSYGYCMTLSNGIDEAVVGTYPYHSY